MVSWRSILFLLSSLYLFYVFFGIPVSYIFRVKTVKDLSHKHSGLFFSEDKLRIAIKQLYPRHVLSKEIVGWFPFYAGGLHGSVSVLYSSFTEFLILFHNEMDTTGSTGRHFMNISTTVLQGKMTYLNDAADISSPIKVSPGENYVLRMGTSAVVKLAEGTTLLVYGRGFLPLTMGYWISYTLFISHDPLLALSTIILFIKACIFSNGSALHWIGQILIQIWKSSSFILDYLLLLPQILIDGFQTLVNIINRTIDSIFKG